MRLNFGSRVFLLCFLTPLVVFAYTPKNIASFSKLPRSIAKDYYIYRYLNEKNPSSNDAQKLLSQAKRVNLKLFYSFAKKMDDQGFKKALICLKLKTKKLLSKDNDCIAMGLSTRDILSLDEKTIKGLSTKLKDYKDINKTLQVLSAKDIFNEALKDKKEFLHIVNTSGDKYREKFFNKTIDEKTINSLSTQKSFNKTIELVMTQRNLQNLQKSFLQITPNPNLSSKSLFFLGLNALEFKKIRFALEWFDRAYKKAYFRFDKDKISFWRYLVSGDKVYLGDLLKSFDINIYTIYAHEQTSTKFDNIITPAIKNKNKKYDIQNPFLWTSLLWKIKDKNTTQLSDITKEFKHRNTVGQYTFLLERINGYKNSYFPTPFYYYLKNYNIKRKALILSLARQESRFVPASVSTSYALGMMQFMPFLARAVAKDEKMKKFDLDYMFKPKIAYKFANIHLNYLQKYLYHPLFVAYAYNGGIGYVKRLLKSGYFFTKKSYEPYLSMELISYPQTRKYGKKVLANYVIYMQLLGEKVSLNSLFQMLMKPSKTDVFRN
jgi:soluble lytic murein transglycosylase